MCEENSDTTGMNPQNELQNRVAKWLAREGYPTEFETASIFRHHGFRVFQGAHFRDDEGAAPREIDVLAVADASLRKGPLIRCEFVVECKWSRDKPWVVFSSKSGHMASPACIAQTISSFLGSAAVSVLAAEKECHAMNLFQTPASPGFGGRQAFSKGNDAVYSSLQSVTSAAVQIMKDYDASNRTGNSLPDCCVVSFPVIVVDGELFEASFNEKSGAMQVESATNLRCHWRGAKSWNLHSTIDLVTLQSLDAYLTVRSPEISKLLELMTSTTRKIATCFETKSLDPLNYKRSSRGIRGLHPLLREAIGAASAD